MSATTRPFRIYGLTGSAGSGKSTAGGFFRELGVPVIDADEIARDLRAPGGEAEEPIRKRFGTLDRLELRKIIASDPAAKSDLEKILHPLIMKESLRRFAALSAGMKDGYALYEAALLVEAGRASDFEGIILVEADLKLQIERLTKRDGMDEVSARQFLGANATDELKRRAATEIIRNNGTLEDLREQVRILHSNLE